MTFEQVQEAIDAWAEALGFEVEWGGYTEPHGELEKTTGPMFALDDDQEESIGWEIVHDGPYGGDNVVSFGVFEDRR